MATRRSFGPDRKSFRNPSGLACFGRKGTRLLSGSVSCRKRYDTTTITAMHTLEIAQGSPSERVARLAPTTGQTMSAMSPTTLILALAIPYAAASCAKRSASAADSPCWLAWLKAIVIRRRYSIPTDGDHATSAATTTENIGEMIMRGRRPMLSDSAASGGPTRKLSTPAIDSRLPRAIAMPARSAPYWFIPGIVDQCTRGVSSREPA